jgi:hypothetical protein
MASSVDHFIDSTGRLWRLRIYRRQQSPQLNETALLASISIIVQ